LASEKAPDEPGVLLGQPLLGGALFESNQNVRNHTMDSSLAANPGLAPNYVGLYRFNAAIPAIAANSAAPGTCISRSTEPCMPAENRITRLW
jgi:hypothetical protein